MCFFRLRALLGLLFENAGIGVTENAVMLDAKETNNLTFAAQKSGDFLSEVLAT